MGVTTFSASITFSVSKIKTSKFRIGCRNRENGLNWIGGVETEPSVSRRARTKGKHMSIREQPHFKLMPSVLASWLDRQAAASWWSVDGDPLLTERLNFPCPSHDLAREFRRINRPLLVLAPQGPQDATVREVEENDLDQLSRVDQLRDRALQLCWEDANPEIDWVLCEDVEVGESSSTSSGQ